MPCPKIDSANFTFHIFSSETTEQISTKLGRNVKQVVLCQIFVRWPHLPTKMATQSNLVLHKPIWKFINKILLSGSTSSSGIYFVEMVPRRTSLRILSIDHIHQPRQLPWPNLMWRRTLWEILKKYFLIWNLTPLEPIFGEMVPSGTFLNCIWHLPTKMAASPKLACAIRTIVSSNGFKVNFILANVWQVSADRLLEASGFKL